MFTLSLGLCLTPGPALAQPPDRVRLERLAARHLGDSFAQLRALLSIPNDARFPEHVERNSRWMEDAFGQRGFATVRLETGGPPLLLARRDAPGASRRVLIYLQIDGQPVDPSRWEQESPYMPVLKRREGPGWRQIPWEAVRERNPEDRIFARSASDAKGPVMMFLTALDVMAREGLEQPWNLTVIMDLEEERGSPHLPAAVVRYRDQLAADMMLVFDGPRHASNRPTLDFGARGIATMTLTVFGPRAPQHSGHYGNYVPNPAQRLARLLASFEDGEGRVVIPGFYDGVRLDEETRALLAGTPDDLEEINRQLGIASTDRVASTLQEAIQYPSLNVRGMAAGWIGEQARTIIPDAATAEIDLRLVPETEAGRLIGLIESHIRSQGYHLIQGREPSEQERRQHARIASFDYDISYRAFRTPYESEVGRWLTRALRRAFDRDPVRIRMGGGSIPIAPFVLELGLPAVGVPTVNKDNNQHSPNENLRLGNYIEGVKTFLAILTEPAE